MFNLKSIFSVFVLCVILATPVSLCADTIRLTNGYTIYGKVSEFSQQPDYYKVSFKNNGWLKLKKTEIKNIEVNDRDQFEERSREGKQE